MAQSDARFDVVFLHKLVRGPADAHICPHLIGRHIHRQQPFTASLCFTAHTPPRHALR